MTRKKLSEAVEPDTEPLREQLARLLAANQRLQAQFDQHVKSEAAWRKERALLLTMLDSVPDYLFAKDRDSRFVMANKATALDLGLESGEDMIGLTDFEMQPDPEVARAFIADDRLVMESGRAKLDIEEFMLDANGEKQWLSTSKVPLRDERGEVTGVVGVARNINERKRAQDQIHFLAYHDALTGLPNRFMFEQQLEKAYLGAHGPGAALLYLDLDRFKNVNDTLGHGAGDELIRQVGARLTALVRATDTVARLGGDEFAVVMPNCQKADDPEALSRRILRELSKPFELFSDTVFINVSIGIAKSQDAPSDKEMWQQADIALYRAKAHGRGRYEVFAEGMAAVAIETRRIEQDLRHALLAGNQLLAHYQPVYAADGTTVVGAEALARWAHPVRGVLGPQAFIGVAEERGLIDEVGEAILREACDVAARANLPWVSVNVSPLQFRRERFDEFVLGILSAANLPPSRLQLEITETALLDNSDGMRAVLGRLRSEGVIIALDDFGTGYSSMNYLRRYNVDKLKIDRSFISQLGTSEDALAIVRAIVSLGTAMRMRVTAEGVETAAQRDMLTGMGCSELQGFFLARPMPPEGLEAFWRRATPAKSRRTGGRRRKARA